MKIKNGILILLLTGLCAAAFAQNKSDFEFNPDGGIITGYNGSGPEVIIPDRIDGVPAAYINNSVFKDKNLTSVSIPDNIKGIGPQAFAGNKLEKVVIGNDVEMVTSAFSAEFIRKYLDEPRRAGGTYVFADDTWEYRAEGIRYLTPEAVQQAPAQQEQNMSPINITIHNYVGKPGQMPEVVTTDTALPPPPAPAAPQPVRNQAAGDVMVSPGLPDPNGNKMYRLQVGAFNSQNAAANTFRSLQDAGFSPVYEHSQNFYRVIIADVPASSVAGTVQRLGAIGIRQIWVRE
jgi:cell division septation protein DedD